MGGNNTKQKEPEPPQPTVKGKACNMKTAI